jgi:hypothetical protein
MEEQRWMQLPLDRSALLGAVTNPPQKIEDACNCP